MNSNTFIHRLMRLLVILIATISTNISATTVLPLSLQQLSDRAELIFYGSVLENKVIRDGNNSRIATLTRFQVHDLVKGQAADTHTIKQIGGAIAGGRSLRIHGVPRYQVGESYVLFLPRPSSLGFSSPVGLQQGNFTVTETDGVKSVSNGARLTGYTGANAARAPLALQADDPTRAKLDDFINSVRAYSRD
jgi:hypothetical protein